MESGAENTRGGVVLLSILTFKVWIPHGVSLEIRAPCTRAQPVHSTRSGKGPFVGQDNVLEKACKPRGNAADRLRNFHGC